ncbi:hypothetical protein GWA97_09670 [Flavobacterium sp. LaA7.5]|nr:hypothetical protein [Flavobacterium salilacus subsp. altitudinum]
MILLVEAHSFQIQRISPVLYDLSSKSWDSIYLYSDAFAEIITAVKKRDSIKIIDNNNDVIEVHIKDLHYEDNRVVILPNRCIISSYSSL